MKRLILIILMFSAFITACSSENISLKPKKESTAYSEKKYNVQKQADFELYCDSGNIDVYTWDRKEAKIEVTKNVRGMENKKDLNAKLDRFKITSNQTEDKIVFKVDYDGKIKAPQDIFTHLVIRLPKRMQNIKIDLDTGKIRFIDEIESNVSFNINAANIDIKKIAGRINLKGDMGSLKIENGKILGDSSVAVNMGNIGIKAECEETGSYSLETGVGNIDFSIPADSKLSFETTGETYNEDFTSPGYPTKVKLSSGMGRISVKKIE